MCPGDLAAPTNGAVTVNGFTTGDTAVYSCDEGYELVGEQTRTCMSNSQWSGAAPTCLSNPGKELSIKESVDSLCGDGADTPIKP